MPALLLQTHRTQPPPLTPVFRVVIRRFHAPILAIGNLTVFAQWSVNNEILILCVSHERVEKDRAIRAKQEGRFLKDLARVQARIQNGRLKNEVKTGEAIGRLKLVFQRLDRRLETRRFLGRRPEFLTACRIIENYGVQLEVAQCSLMSRRIVRNEPGSDPGGQHCAKYCILGLSKG